MSIDIRKYVRVISGVAGSGAVRQRDVIGRIFTQNPIVSPSAILEFETADAVGKLFGTSSEEYRRAVAYFGYISPATTAARKISFARFAPTGAAASIYGGTDVKNLTAIKQITAGALSFVLDGAAVVISGLNFAAAASLADVASVVQTAIQTNTDPTFATATFTYDAVTRRFVFIGGDVAAHTINTAVNSAGGDVGAALELYESTGAVMVSGVGPQTMTDAVTAANSISDNYGSFVFAGAKRTLDEIVAVAQYNATFNVKFMFMVLVEAADAAAWSTALIGTAGVAMTLGVYGGTEYPEQAPMTIQAATDYTKRNAAPNYMYRQFGSLSPTVFDTEVSDAYDVQRVNYYGRTSSAGQNIDFYQRGTLGGVSTDPVDQNTFANEAWLKDAMTARLLSLQLSLTTLPASDAGRGYVLGVLQQGINDALFNGVISVGKPLNITQQLDIGQLTGDELAWLQVQNIGYWVDAVIESYVTQDGRTEYKITYRIIYSKNDAVRSIEGTHTLI